MPWERLTKPNAPISKHASPAIPKRKRCWPNIRVSRDSLVMTAPLREAPAHLGQDLRQRVAHHQDSTAVAEVTPKRKPTPVLTRWLAAAAILAVIFGLTFAVTQLQQPQPSAWYQNGWDLYRHLQDMTDVLSVEITPADNYEEIWGKMLANPADNTAVIRVSNIPAPGDDQTYQLWLVDKDGQVTSGGLYKEVVDGTMYVTLPIDKPLDSYQAFGCSLEPAGGSPYPNKRSGPGVFRVQLGSA